MWQPLTLEQQYTIGHRLVLGSGLQEADQDEVVQRAVISLWRSGKEVGKPKLARAVSYEEKHIRRNWSRHPSISLDMEVTVEAGDSVPFGETVPDDEWPIEEKAMLHEAINAIEQRWPGLVDRVLSCKGPLDQATRDFLHHRRKEMLKILHDFVEHA